MLGSSSHLGMQHQDAWVTCNSQSPHCKGQVDTPPPGKILLESDPWWVAELQGYWDCNPSTWARICICQNSLDACAAFVPETSVAITAASCLAAVAVKGKIWLMLNMQLKCDVPWCSVEDLGTRVELVGGSRSGLPAPPSNLTCLCVKENVWSQLSYLEAPFGCWPYQEHNQKLDYADQDSLVIVKHLLMADLLGWLMLVPACWSYPAFVELQADAYNPAPEDYFGQYWVVPYTAPPCYW